ncbi:MAG: nucleoside monophosphate kinase, partial [Chloroflexota bacterium]
MIKDRLSRDDCNPGAILDGFPRTPPQAEALDAMLEEFGGQISLVPYIKVPKDVLIGRLSGRWTCRANGHIFHESFNPPKQTGMCDIDQSELYQRDDDQSETVVKRIQVYLEQTAPLIHHFTDKKLIVEIDGDQAIEDVTAVLRAALREEA